MASSNSSSTPSDHNAPLAVVNENDHGAWVLICNAFGLVVVLITLLIRVYLRKRVSPPFGIDDWLLVGATALAVVQVGVVFAQVNAGFGRASELISETDLVRIQVLNYAADVLFVAGLYASKSCVVLFFKRLTVSRSHGVFSWAVLSSCLLFFVASILVISLRCDLTRPWIWYNGGCGGLIARWRAVAALDVTSEALLFAMSLHLVWDLQTSIARKSKVVFAFALRLLVILVAFVRLDYVEKQIESADPTLSGATVAVLTQIELFYSTVAATIPCLRPFLVAFVTNYGAMGGETIMHGSHIGSSQAKGTKGSNATSFALQSLDSARRAMTQRERDGEPATTRGPSNFSGEMLRPDTVVNRISASHGKSARGADAVSIGSEESTKGTIIKKEVGWQVDNESYRTRRHSSTHPQREEMER